MEDDPMQRNSWTFVLDEPTPVLIVDDEDDAVLEFANVYLLSSNAVIETAPDGTTAWSMPTSIPAALAPA